MNRSIQKMTACLMALILAIGMLPLGALADILGVTDYSGGISMARISPITHTTTYVFKNGANTVDTQIVQNNQALSAPATPEAPAGQRFVGWFAQGAATPMAFNVPITVTATSSVTVNATFEDVVYVSFAYDSTPDDQTNNAAIIATKAMAPGATTDDSGVPLVVGAPGKAFSHWSQTVGGSAFPFASTPIHANLTLYAVLTDKWQVHFDSHGGTTVLPQYITHGSAASEPSMPTRQGYAFAGWATDAAGTAPYNFSSSVTGPLTLHAVWTPGQANYSVIYWLQNTDDNNYTYDQTLTRSGTLDEETTYSVEPYVGFTLDANRTNAAANKSYVKSDGTAVKNVYYNRNTYTFTMEYLRQGSSRWRTLSTTTLRFGQSTVVPYEDAVEDYPNHGWYTTRDSSISYTEAPVMGAADLTVHGRYDGDTKFYVRYVEKGTNTDIKPSYMFYGSGNYSLTKEDGIAITGFTVTPMREWKEWGRDRTAIIYYTRNTYTITFTPNNNTGSVVSEAIPYQADISGRALAGYSEGVTTYEQNGVIYTFGGWFVSPSLDGATKFSFAGKTMPANNMVLFGKWIPPVHSVKYYLTPDAGGPSGTVSGIPHGQPVSGSAVHYNMPAGLTAADFLGWHWYVGSTFMPYDFARPVTDSSVVLYPAWKEQTYTITYDANGGSGAAPVDSVRYASGAQAVVMGAGQLSLTDRVFLGWNTKADGSGTAFYPNNKATITEDLLLFAQWGIIPPTTSITYHRNSGEAGDVPITENLLNNATHVIKPANTFSRPGYNFIGWNTNANGNGTPYQPGTSVMITAGTTNELYAQWQAATVDVVATKIWDGGHSVNHVIVTLKLYRQIGSGTPQLVTDAPSISPNTGISDEFVYTWENQPIGDGQNTYTYSVQEVTTGLPSGYTSIVQPTSGGYNFTVTNTYHNIGDVEAFKYWYTDGVVPQLPDVWFQLYRYTEANPTLELVPKQNIKFMPGGTFHWKLPKMPNADPSGNAYIYIVKEVDANGNDYVPAGYEKVEATDKAAVHNYRYGRDRKVTVTKDWSDVPIDKRSSISVTLFMNGEMLVKSGVTNPVILDANNNWTYSWTGLVNYYNQTTLNNYTVTEDTSTLHQHVVFDEVTYTHTDITPGYLTTATIKNRLVDMTSVSGTKTWADNDDQDGIRPDSITVKLMNGNAEVDSRTVTGPEWKYTFSNLPKYANGVEIAYTIAEADVEGYTSEPDGYNLTNTHTPATRTVRVSKLWVDNDNKTDLRAPVTLRLDAKVNGQIIPWTDLRAASASGQQMSANGKVTLTAKANESHDFNHLPLFYEGNAVQYEVVEETVLNGYNSPEYGETENDGKTATNRILSSTLTIAKLIEGTEYTETEPFEFRVVFNGDEEDFVTFTLRHGERYPITNLPYGLTYRVSETQPDGFIVTYDENATGTLVGEDMETIITNIYQASGTYDIDADLNPTKSLAGRVLADQEFSFELREGDELIEAVQNTADGNIPFSALTFDQDDIGEHYYTIREVDDGEVGMTYDPGTLAFIIQVADIGGHRLEATVIKPDSVTFNNTFVPQTMDIAVDKQWADNNNAAGLRPASIQAQLLQNGEPLGQPVTISAANGWTTTYPGLPIRDGNGTPYIYTVRETATLTNYLPTYQGLAAGRLTIINTLTEVPTPPPAPPAPPAPGPAPAPEAPAAAPGNISGNLGETFE